MVINSLSGLSGNQNSQNIERATSRLQAAIASLVSGKRVERASDDVAELALATQLQAQSSALKQVSSNLAQGSSLAQVADGGIEQIQKVVEELRSVAAQASSPTLNDANRSQFNQQFQQLVKEIDRIVSNTQFGGKKLLDGTISGENSLSVENLLGEEGSEGGVEIESLSSSELFEGQSLNVLSTGNASQAVNVLSSVLNRVLSVRSEVGSFQATVDFAVANIDSAVANQEAARSLLQDTDFAEAATDASLAQIQLKASIAVAAQGNRLSPAVLKLVG